MQQITKAASPVVARTFNRKRCVQGARQSLTWGGLNFMLATLMYLELFYGPLFETFHLLQPLLYYIECFLALLFTANVLWDCLAYLAWTLSAGNVDINPLQRRLMGIKEYETGFRNPSSTPPPKSKEVPTPIFSPSNYQNCGGFSGLSTPTASPRSPIMAMHQSFQSDAFGMMSPLGAPLSPLAPTPSPRGRRPPSVSPRSSSPGSNHSSSFVSTGLGASGSFIGAGGVLDNSSLSYSMPGLPSPLSATNTLSPLFREADVSGLRSRITGSGLKASPMRREDCITNQRSLDQFLNEQHDKEHRKQVASPEASTTSGTSFWNYNRSLIDHTPILRKYQYQIACRSPQQAHLVKDDDTEEAMLAQEVWSQHHIHPLEADRWIENLRKWLCNTIFTHLLTEMNKVNGILARIGCEDMLIGEVSISTLKQLATTKAQHVPTLNSIIPFLEISANQEYLVSRIRELGGGGAMSGFKWNGGGVYKGQSWDEHLPSDAAIIMHLLCTYMDARLPPHPKYPDGKTFTTQYFMKTPDKPDLKNMDNLLIYQAKINPPHFKIILGDDVLNPPKGRNNMFHAILLFLRDIHVKHHGMLGRINLGLSGINILWVLEAKLADQLPRPTPDK